MKVGKIIKKSGGYFFGRLGLLAVNFVLLTLIARFIGPEQYGIFSIATSVIFTATLFVDLGIGQSLVYYIPKYSSSPGKARDLLDFGIKIRFIVALIVGAILFILSDTIAQVYNIAELVWALQLFSFAFFSYTIIMFLTQISIALKKVEHAVLFEALMISAKVLSLGLFVYMGISGVYIGYSSGMVLAFILGIAVFYKIYPRAEKKRTGKRKFIKYASFIYLGIIFLAVYSRILPLALGYFSTPEQVAYFTVGTALTSFIFLAANSIGTVAQPSITDSKERKLPEELPKIFRYMIFSTVPLGVFGVLLAKDVLQFFYGAEYVAGATIFSISAIASTIYGITFGYTSLALGVGRAGSFLKSQAFQALAGILGIFILIPIYEGTGAAAALIVINTTGPLYLSYKLRGYKVKYPWKSLIKSLAASVAIAGTVAFIGNFFSGILKLALSGIIGISLYSLVLYALGGIKKQELQSLFPKLK